MNSKHICKTLLSYCECDFDIIMTTVWYIIATICPPVLLSEQTFVTETLVIFLKKQKTKILGSDWKCP